LGFQYSNIIEIDDYDSYIVGAPVTGGPEGSPLSDFSLETNPIAQVKKPGDAATFSIITRITNGNGQSINLSVSGLPAGVSSSFSSSTITAGQSTDLTIFTSSATPPGDYNLSITGNGTTSHSTSIKLTIGNK